MQPNPIAPAANNRFHPIVAVALQAISGLVLGVISAISGAGIGSRFFADEGDLVDRTIAGVNGALAFYPLGVALGVALSGRLVGRHAPFWAALVGAYLGTLALLPLLFLGLSADTRLLWIMMGLLGLIGALVVYNWQRRSTA